MYRQLPASLPYNALRNAYSSQYRHRFIKSLMKMMGFIEEDNFLPVIEETDKRFVFVLAAGETQTQSFPANDECWVCVDRSFTATLNTTSPQNQFPVISLIKASSWVNSEVDETKVTLVEDGPVNLLFGTGEWPTSSMFPERTDSINNRIWSLSNESEFPAIVTLNFKFVRVQRRLRQKSTKE